jgi:hypothetical protein
MKKFSFDAYTLKWIAVVAMVMNHVAIAFHAFLPFPVLLVFYAVGGLTYTIMGFFVVEGYRYTSNLKKYISRLLLFGLIAQAFHPMVLGATQIMPGIFLNILFTISLSLIVLLMYDKIKIRVLFWLLFIIACVAALFMDLFFVAVLMTLLYYAIKKEGSRRMWPGIIAGIIWLVLGLLTILSLTSLQSSPGGAEQAQYMFEEMGMTVDLVFAMPTFAIGCFLGAVLIRNYNGDRGKPAKWLFYVAYPLHLAVLAGIAVVIGITEFSLFGF